MDHNSKRKLLRLICVIVPISTLAVAFINLYSASQVDPDYAELLASYKINKQAGSLKEMTDGLHALTNWQTIMEFTAIMGIICSIFSVVIGIGFNNGHELLIIDYMTSAVMSVVPIIAFVISNYKANQIADQIELWTPIKRACLNNLALERPVIMVNIISVISKVVMHTYLIECGFYNRVSQSF